MVKNYNRSIVLDANRIFDSKQGDEISSELIPNIQPTVEIKRYANIARNLDRSSTGSATIFSVPSDKDFYLTSAQFSASADATADNTTFALIATVEGVSRRILTLNKLTTSAFTGQTSLSFPTAIKIDRGTNITITSTFTLGTANYGACISGYTVETTK